MWVGSKSEALGALQLWTPSESAVWKRNDCFHSSYMVFIERSAQWLLLVVVVVVVEVGFLEERILRCPLGSFSEADWQEVDFSWGEAGCQSVSVIKWEQVLRWTEPTAVQAALSGVHMLHVFPFCPGVRGVNVRFHRCWKLKFFFKSSIPEPGRTQLSSCFVFMGRRRESKTRSEI